MSNPQEAIPRPVSLATIAALFACFAVFIYIAYAGYATRRPPPAQFIPAERLPADLAWEATPQGRSTYLAELRARQSDQATTYGWVDRKAGIVRLPIDRAIDLTVQAYTTKK